MPKGEPLLPAVEHYAFFDTLGKIVERAESDGMSAEDAENLPAYRAALAGLLTLRLVDRCVSRVGGMAPSLRGLQAEMAPSLRGLQAEMAPSLRGLQAGMAPSLRELQAARRAVQACEPGPLRNALDALIRAVQGSSRGLAPGIGAHAFAYARLLQDEMAVMLAADAYMSVVGCAQASGDAGLVPAAFIQMGFCYRTAGWFTEAELACTRAAAAANQLQDVYHVLMSRLGHATIAYYRGNLPRAEAMLDTLIRDIQVLPQRSPELTDLLGRAKHDRGVVLGGRGEDHRAIVDLFDALELYTDSKRRTRALHDLATALIRLGARSAARDALHICHATAVERELRWNCALNLMELAEEDGEETVFERWRRDLGAIDLPPRQRTYFLIFSGEGLYRFGRIDAARAALAGALVVAERHGLNELIIRADAALAAIERNEQLPAATAQSPSVPGIAQIADRLRGMRLVHH